MHHWAGLAMGMAATVLGAGGVYALTRDATPSTLRAIVAAAVLALGLIASVSAFVLIRVVRASALRERRLRKLGRDLHRRDRDIQRRRAEAEAASAAKSDMLRRTSHNIRSPLTGILGITETLLERVTSGEERSQLSTVRSSARYLLALANDLLDLARAESGRAGTAACDTEPTGLLEEIIAGMREQAESKGLTLAVRWTGAVPAVIRVDPTRVREILTNLLDNAVRHTSRGGVSLAARVERKTQELHLEVIDTGEGIEPERLATMLASDESDPQFSPERGTHGLGLAITQHLISAMGGAITIDSRERLGTVVSLVLPVGPVRWGEPPDLRAACGEGASVLVVDDAQEIRQFMRLAMGRVGLAVRAAGSGGEALSAAASGGSCRLVFLDQHLAETTGVELLDRLRGTLPDAAFVALTGDTGPDAERRYLDAGFDAYLSKPFTQGQLLALLDRFGFGGLNRAA